jgi:hypothetical protein
MKEKYFTISLQIAIISINKILNGEFEKKFSIFYEKILNFFDPLYYLYIIIT